MSWSVPSNSWTKIRCIKPKQRKHSCTQKIIRSDEMQGIAREEKRSVLLYVSIFKSLA